MADGSGVGVMARHRDGNAAGQTNPTQDFAAVKEDVGGMPHGWREL